jgi:hypothetical protein
MIKSEYVDECARQKYSEKSSKKLKLALDNPTKNARVELAAVADGGGFFCKACYMLESEQPMIFVGYDKLMHVHCNRTGTSFTKLEQASHEAAAMMTSSP